MSHSVNLEFGLQDLPAAVKHFLTHVGVFLMKRKLRARNELLAAPVPGVSLSGGQLLHFIHRLPAAHNKHHHGKHVSYEGEVTQSEPQGPHIWR